MVIHKLLVNLLNETKAAFRFRIWDKFRFMRKGLL